MPVFAHSNPRRRNLLLASYGISIIHGLVYHASLKPIAGLLSSIVSASQIGEQGILNVIQNERRALLVFGSAIISLNILSSLLSVVDKRIKGLYTQEFYDDMATTENQTKITLLRSDEKNGEIDLLQLSQAYANYTFALYNIVPRIFLAISAQTLYTYFVSSPMGERSLISSVKSLVTLGTMVNLTIVISKLALGRLPNLLKYRLEEEQEAEANLNGIRQTLNKSVLTHINATSVAKLSLGERFETYWKASSPLSMYHFLGLASAVSCSILDGLRMPLTLILAAGQGYNMVIKELTAVLIASKAGLSADLRLDEFNKDLMQYTDFYIKLISTRPCYTEEIHQTKGFEKQALVLRAGTQIRHWSNSKLVAEVKAEIIIKYKEVALIKGLSACGKTTLLEGIAGFSYSLQSGVSLKMDATLQQKDICYIPSAQVKQDFGGCNIFKFITSGMEVTVDNEKMLRKAAIKYIQALLLVGMDNIDMELPETLSNGQMKRLLLVKGFVQGARLLLLDETISALSADRRGKSESERECCIRVIREYMTEKNAAVICVSHEETLATQSMNFASQVIEFGDGGVITAKRNDSDASENRRR